MGVGWVSHGSVLRRKVSNLRLLSKKGVYTGTGETHSAGFPRSTTFCRLTAYILIFYNLLLEIRQKDYPLYLEKDFGQQYFIEIKKAVC